MGETFQSEWACSCLQVDFNMQNGLLEIVSQLF
jgi:hypothetical protein